MTEEQRVHVIVLGNSEGEICRGGWGPRRSSAETTELTKGYLGRIYGDRVQVDYYDMAEPETYEQHKALLEEVPSGYMYYPMVFIDGDLKVSGGADPYQVMYAVQTLLKEQAEKA